MPKRCTKLEKEQRVLTIVKLLASGAVNSEVIEFARREWGLEKKATYPYLREAREVIIEDIDRDRREVTAELMITMKNVIKQSIKDRQFSNAIGASNLLAKLGGLIDR